MGPIKVLFVCTFRGGRGKIAEMVGNSFGNVNIEFFCSGFEAGFLKGLCSEVMEDVGFEFPVAPLKTVFERHLDNEKFDYLITMCGESTFENCFLLLDSVANLFGDTTRFIHWSIPDFIGLSGSEFEKKEGAQNIKHLIMEHVANLIEEIGALDTKV